MFCRPSARQHAVQSNARDRENLRAVCGIADGRRTGHGWTERPDACAIVQLPFRSEQAPGNIKGRGASAQSMILTLM